MFYFRWVEIAKEFLPAVRKAVDRGLPESAALAALTTNPAKSVSAENLVGSLKRGLMANVIVADGPLFDKETKLVEHWVSGEPTILVDRNALDLGGNYSLTIGANTADLVVEKLESGRQKSK